MIPWTITIYGMSDEVSLHYYKGFWDHQHGAIAMHGKPVILSPSARTISWAFSEIFHAKEKTIAIEPQILENVVEQGPRGGLVERYPPSHIRRGILRLQDPCREQFKGPDARLDVYTQMLMCAEGW
jgi:hypothetical protein